MENGDDTTEQVLTPNEIRDLIAKEKVKQAFAESRLLAESMKSTDLLNKITTQSGKFEKNEGEFLSGIIDDTVYNRERSKTISALLVYLNELEDLAKKVNTPSTNNKKGSKSNTSSSKDQSNSASLKKDNPEDKTNEPVKFNSLEILLLVLSIISNLLAIIVSFLQMLGKTNPISGIWHWSYLMWLSIFLLLVALAIGVLFKIKSDTSRKYIKSILIGISLLFSLTSGLSFGFIIQPKLKILRTVEHKINILAKGQYDESNSQAEILRYFEDSAKVRIKYPSIPPKTKLIKDYLTELDSGSFKTVCIRKWRSAKCFNEKNKIRELKVNQK